MRHQRRTAHTEFEEINEEALHEDSDSDISDLIEDMRQTLRKLEQDKAHRADVKLLRTALRELRYAFKVFAPYRDTRKATVFGSARLPPEHPAYQQAVKFSQKLSEAGFAIITGAAAGIMEAGHVGAGRENSFGVNILLPFEQESNPIIQGDPKLMHFKYFFTRKLLFVKEADAIVLFPGGFGTQDEGFEALTLVQTGKSHLFPIVMVDEPGGDYWQRWAKYVEEVLVERKLVSSWDTSLYKVTDSVDEAVEEVVGFYRTYHSMRFVKDELVFRLHTRLSDQTLDEIRKEFTDLLTGGTFEQSEALPEESNEPQLEDLPRLRFRFDRHKLGRLRMLIDVINRSSPQS